jgi:hypothetical protein
VVDVFYVRDFNGQKAASAQKERLIKTTIEDELFNVPSHTQKKMNAENSGPDFQGR